MQALLRLPDRQTQRGHRDYTLLLFLYNTGCRADEVAQLTIADLDLALRPRKERSFVKVMGKGRKVHRCPLWPVDRGATHYGDRRPSPCPARFPQSLRAAANPV